MSSKNRLEESEWTPANIFTSKYSGMDDEKLATLNADQIARHLHSSLYIELTHSSCPMFHPAGLAATDFPEARILGKLMDCVAARAEDKSEAGRNGLIGIGQFQIPVEDFAAQMVAWHPKFTYAEGPKPGEISHLHDKMADVLGAGNFKNLEVMEMIEQSREWLAGAISGAIKREYDHRHTSESARASNDVTVWMRMNNIMGDVQTAFVTAVEAGAIDEKTANQIVMRSQMHASEKSGHWKDWAPLSTGLLHGMNTAIADLQKQMKKTGEVTPAVTRLADALISATWHYNQAKSGIIGPSPGRVEEKMPGIIPLGEPVMPLDKAIAQLVAITGKTPESGLSAPAYR